MNAEHVACASSAAVEHWGQIDWKRCERQVTRLQARIVKASREGRWGKVRCLQRLASRKGHRSHRCIATSISTCWIRCGISVAIRRNSELRYTVMPTMRSWCAATAPKRHLRHLPRLLREWEVGSHAASVCRRCDSHMSKEWNPSSAGIRGDRKENGTDRQPRQNPHYEADRRV